MTNIGKPVKVIHNEPAPLEAPMFVPLVKVPVPVKIAVR